MNEWVGKRCLVLGGAGAVGSALAERLLEQGAKVTVVDDLSEPKSKNSSVFGGREGLKFIYRRAEDIVGQSKLWRCDVVFQLARQQHDSELTQVLANLGLFVSVSRAVAQWRPDHAVFLANTDAEDQTLMMLVRKLVEERGIDAKIVRLDSKPPEKIAEELINACSST